MTDFGWSYPPGCNSVPDDDRDFDLDEQEEGDLPIVVDPFEGEEEREEEP